MVDFFSDVSVFSAFTGFSEASGFGIPVTITDIPATPLMSSQCQSAEIITSLGALDRVGYLGNEYLLILIRDLEDTVHVVIELYEATALGRIQSDLQ